LKPLKRLSKIQVNNLATKPTNFDMQAVSRALCARQTAAIRPAPPAPTTRALRQSVTR